jgi:hypothetical protein
MRLEMHKPFRTEAPRADVVQFVSILSEAGRRRVSLPNALPEVGDWLVRIIGSKNRLVHGVYRRHMKKIGCLGPIDKLFGAPATTRSWNTILSVLRILRSYEPWMGNNRRRTVYRRGHPGSRNMWLRMEEAEVRAAREPSFLAPIRDRITDTHEEASSHDR